MVPSAVTAMTESELSHPNEELDFMQQKLLDEEMDCFLRYHTPLTSASENVSAWKAEDLQWGQQQCQPLPEPLASTHGMDEGLKTSPEPVHTSQSALAVKNVSDDVPSLLQPPDVAEAICLMVEDPYFDASMGSTLSEEAPVGLPADTKLAQNPVISGPSLLLNDQSITLDSPASGEMEHLCFCVKEKKATRMLLLSVTMPSFVCTVKGLIDKESPPPLPERTPESYVLAVDAG